MTNNQAEAYAKLAMQGLKMDNEDIKRVLEQMRWLFNKESEEEVCMKVFGCRS